MQAIEIQEGFSLRHQTTQKEPGYEATWLARVKKVDKDTVTLVWWEGGYNSK